LAKEPKGAPAPRLGFQSAPVYLYHPATERASVDLDVGHPKGQIAVKLSEPLPRLNVEGKYVIDSRLYLRVEPQAVRYARWTAKSAMPEHWPLSIHSPEAAPDPPEEEERSRSLELRSHAVLSNEDVAAGEPVSFFGSRDLLTAGPYRVTAAVVADIKPFDQSDEVGEPSQPGFYGGTQPSIQWMSLDWIRVGNMGHLWQSKLRSAGSGRGRGGFGGQSPPANLFSSDNSVELRAGMLTRIQVEIPTDVVSRIQNVVEASKDAEQFAAAVRKEQPFLRYAKVTVVGVERQSEATSTIPRK
jgi:hypothetical protein